MHAKAPSKKVICDRVASFPGLPHIFCSSVCVDNNTWMGGGGGGGGCSPTANNKPQTNLCRSSESLDYSRGAFEPSRLGDEQPAEMTTSTSRPADVTHVMNDTRPSTFFTALPHPCIIIYCQRKLKNRKNRVGLGMRLPDPRS